MYADRYARPGGLHPGSLGMALGLNAAVLAALMLANPQVVRHVMKDPLTIINVTEPPEPDPIKPEVLPKPQPAPRTPPITAPDPVVKTQPTNPFTLPPMPPEPPVTPASTGTGTDAGTIMVEPPKSALPVMVQPGVDPRYAGLFQPPYPPSEERAGRIGRVVVRVLIGVDGRVKQLEAVSATSDAFLNVTRERALGKWRFTPATRDGIPVEAWKIMSVRFELND